MTQKREPSQRRAIETRDRILDAAEGLIDETGNADFSMNELRKKAGMSAGGLYEWFSNKEDVLDGIMERHVDVATAQIEELLGEIEAMPLETKIRTVLQTGLAMHEARPVFHRFLYMRAPRSPDVEATLDEFERSIERIIQSDLEASGLEQKEAAITAAITHRAGQALLHDLVLDANLPGDKNSRLEAVVQLLVNATSAGTD